MPSNALLVLVYFHKLWSGLLQLKYLWNFLLANNKRKFHSGLDFHQMYVILNLGFKLGTLQPALRGCLCTADELCYCEVCFSFSVISFTLDKQCTDRQRIPANICWSWRRLQHVFNVTILRLPRRLEDVL